MPQNKTKEQLIKEFSIMREFEKWTGEFYEQMASNPRAGNERVRLILLQVAADERKHTDIVQKIINIINYNL